MKNIPLNAAALAALLFSAAGTQAGPIIYPAKGQSAQLQQKDDGECYSWSKNKTGVDPAAQSPATATTQPAAGGERVRGAARGALGGAAIGAIAGDTGKGAAIGATVGTMRGGARTRQQAADQQAAAQQSANNSANASAEYQRAYSACMEGRGYTVK